MGANNFKIIEIIPDAAYAGKIYTYCIRFSNDITNVSTLLSVAELKKLALKVGDIPSSVTFEGFACDQTVCDNLIISGEGNSTKDKFVCSLSGVKIRKENEVYMFSKSIANIDFIDVEIMGIKTDLDLSKEYNVTMKDYRLSIVNYN